MSSSTHAVTGWLGVLNTINGPLRFSSESINIPQGVELVNDVHVGQRVPGVYRYTLVKPAGTFSFPLMAALSGGVSPGLQSNAVTPALEPVSKFIMQTAIKPYEDSGYPPTHVPELGDIYLHRGDINKYIQDAWVNSITVSGQANSDISVSVDIKGIYGAYAAANSNYQAFTDPIRTIHFNELYWGTEANFGLTRVGGTSTIDGRLRPRNFTLTINQNLIDDDSYNPASPQAIIGFAFGQQTVDCNMTFVGSYLPPSPGTPQIISDAVIGNMYSILMGVWTSKTINIPGPSEIATTDLTLAGLSTALYSVIPTPGGIIA